MGSLTAVFNLATQTLLADQSALQVVSNNVANQNTVGYTRQVATFTEGATIQLGGGAASYTAPSVTAVAQRNRVLEQRVQQQTQATSASAAESGILSQIESIFNLSSTSTTAGATQLGTATDAFFSSLTALSANPADASTQQAVITSATALASAFNASASQVTQIQQGVNQTIASTVQTVNGLTRTIAELNAEIQQQSPHADAGALEDQRQTAIAQLSQSIGLDQISTENNGLTLTTTGGALLVEGSTAKTLSASVVDGVAQIQNAAGADVTSGVTGGSLGGLLTAQTKDIPALQSGLDSLAARVATAVNRQNQAGQTSAGVPGAAIFSLPSSTVGSAAAIAVIPTSGATLATAATGEGSTGNTNALALAQLQQQTDASGNTADQQLAALLSTVGAHSSAVTEQNTAQQATLTQLTTQRDSLSAVSLDEEAASLTQYQNSYNAAAKLFSIINTIFTSALNLGVETTYA